MNTPVVVENTSHITSIHQYLDTRDWNIEGLTKFLKQNPSSINEVKTYDSIGGTPFIRVLESSNCTFDIVQLLLHHGADVNLEDLVGRLPLMSALWHCTEDKVIEMLLDKGARVDIHGDFGESPLCVAIRCNFSKHLFKLLLDAGCSLRSCENHGSAMHCFCSVPTIRNGMREDILKLMIEAGAEVSKLDAQERSPMCFAFDLGARPRDIELLMQVGVSLNACKKHPSPFHCLVGYLTAAKPLEADVVKTLLNAGACFDAVDEDGIALLHHILHSCKYDSEAFKLLLDVSGVHVNHGCDFHGTLLHCAVSSFFCQLSAVKFLLDKGAKVEKVNPNGDTALDVVIRRMGTLDLATFLVKKGSPINAQHHTTSKPLMLAVESHMHPEVIMMLLIAGARIGMKQDCIGQPFLTLTGITQKKHPVFEGARDLRLLGEDQIGVNCIKYLVKCYGLEYSAFDIEDLVWDWSIRDELQGFAEECKLELQQMDSENIGYGRSLHQLISRISSPRTIAAGCMTEGKDFNFNQLLETLSDKAFPLYFDIISVNVGKLAMEKKLQEVPVYTVKRCPHSPCSDKKVTLIYDAVLMIACYLSDAELLRLILAFYNPKKPCW